MLRAIGATVGDELSLEVTDGLVILRPLRNATPGHEVLGQATAPMPVLLVVSASWKFWLEDLARNLRSARSVPRA